MSTEQNVIYQQQEGGEIEDFDNHDAIPKKLKLDLRGTRMELERDTLVNLPESLLIAMFPNGLVLPRYEDTDDEEDDDSFHSGIEEQVNQVDFDPVCLEHVLSFYQKAAQIRDENQQHVDLSTVTSPIYYTLLTKQPIIVLREELEYFCVPVQTGQSIQHLKLASGKHLKQHDLIFDALEKNIFRENNVAEQHLIDMLCDAGFHRDDHWSYREIEPTKTTIISMALVLLKTVGPDNHMATAQKLFLFWRKPARKCWWDGNTVEIEGENIRLWARRTWTLELALV